ncbi:autotransporter outer membrane beta-barrel domain-containing protein [Mesorhizobium sp. CA14]|uniref:autotransporter outer membrane beta-barrel domain-containing protein n=1 Tax=Mesorhizobium sp. CA14 TaxID=2876642 RepID=UPI001CCE6517|nr:autotransporter outer membrane beta-barrel domain-containing protein [Mesorhizobium sp. CA14]MBZ9847929.1 autotransporter outer membrane beta-barrel domain-containing protein [Mesorhizobium sp. CA14]
MSGRSKSSGEKRRSRALLTGVSIGAMVMCGWSTSARAQVWQGTTSADWTVGSNWSTGTAPSGTATVTINTNSPNPAVLGVSGAASATIGNLQLNMSAGTSVLTVQNGSTLSSSVTTGTNYIGRVGNGTVTVTGAGSSWSSSASTLIGFGSGSAGTLNIANGANVSLGTLSFGAANATINATLNITGGGTLTSGNTTLFGSATTSAANISGAGSSWNVGGFLTVGRGQGNAGTGSGTLKVTNGAVVTATGIITIAGNNLSGAGTGTVTVSGTGSQLNTSAALNIGAYGQGTLTVSNGAAATANTVTMTAIAASTATLNISGDGTLSTGALTAGPGTVQANFDGATLRATASNTAFISGFTGTGLNIAAGGLTLDTGAFSVTAISPFSGTGAITKIGTGTGTTISAGTLQLGNGGASGSILGDVTNNGTLAFDRSDAYTFAGLISGNGAVNQIGSGTTILTADNGYTGGTTISAGTLQLGNGGASGSILGDVTNNGTLAFDRSDAYTFAGLISGNGAVNQIGSGTTILTADNGYTGGTTISAGTLQLGNGGASGSITGDVVDNGMLAFDRSDAVTFGGVISGTGGLNQIGAGTTILTAANSYGGPTNVNSGTLLVNGNQAGATGQTAVAGGATLGGTGIIGGDVTMADGSTLSPGGSGNSAGALTINGNLTLSGGTSLAYNFGQANAPGGALNDVVNVGGNLTLDGTLNITPTAGGSFGPGVYRVFNYNGALIDNGLALTSPDYSVQTSIANQVNLINTAGQLLTFWDGDAGPKNNSVVDGGNGTWQVAGSGNNWTTPGGEVNAPWSNGQFAVFQGTPGTVSVDNGNGAVTVNGMQFAADGYVIQGGDISLVGPQSTIRVGDGSSAGAGYKATIASDLVGNSGLTKVDYGTLILAGNSSYVGATTVQGGTLAAGKAGAFNATSAFAVQSGGTLDLAGFDQTVASLNNSGAVRLGAAAPGTVLTVSGDYVGNGGKILINAALNGDASATDRLVVHGNTSGTGILAVTNVGGAGAQTSEGIKIVDIDGSSAGTFTLAGDYIYQGDQAVVGGAYAYRLYKNGVSTPSDGDWYLRSTLINQTGPLYAPSTPLYEAYAGVLQSFNELGTLQQRIGNRAWGEDATPQGADVPGQGPVDGNAIWARVDAAHGKFEPKTSTTGTDYDVTTWKINAGVDGLLHDSEAGILLGGITVHYGTVASDVSSTFGTGSISATGYGVGGTLTWFGNSGFYVDTQAQATWYDSDINSAELGKLADGNNGFGYALSIESGQKIALRSNWSLTPQAQLSYSAVDFDKFTDRFGAIVSPGSGDSLIGRLGISADYEDQWADSAGQVSRAHVYGIANLYYDFLGGTDVDVSGVKLASQNQKFWGGVGLGGSLDFGDGKYSVYGEALAKTSLASFGDSNVISGKLGFSVRW